MVFSISSLVVSSHSFLTRGSLGAVRAHHRFCGDQTWGRKREDRIFWVHHDPDTARSFLIVYTQRAPYNRAKWDLNLRARYYDGVCV